MFNLFLENTLLINYISICIINYIISRLYLIVNNKRATLFTCNRKIIIQTILIWIIISTSQAIGIFVKYLLYFFTEKDLRIYNKIDCFFIALGRTLSENPISCFLSFATTVFLCFSLIMLFNKFTKIERKTKTALTISILCAPYFLFVPIILVSKAFILFNYLFCSLLFLPYVFYKVFSSITYYINRKLDNKAIDNRLNCILSAFIGEFSGIISIIIIGSIFNLDIYESSLLYGNTNNPSKIFIISFLFGLFINFILLVFWCFKPFKKNNIKQIINVIVLTILNAPYNLLVILFVFLKTR